MRLFIVIAAVFGVAFVFITPPLEVPDEAAHYWRACAIAHGVFQPVPQYGQGYSAIPAGERELGISGGKPLRLFRSIPYVRERVIVRYPLSLSPLPFVPQALGIAVGDVLRLRPLFSFYLGRLLSLAASLALVTLAMRALPAARSIFATCALLPMTLFMFASFSPDGMTIAMTFVAAALALSGSAWIILATIALALCKPYLLVPLVVLATRRRALVLATMATTIAGGFIAKSLASTSATWIRPDVNADVQLEQITHHPLHVALVIAGDLAQHAALYGRQMIGTLGWLAVPLPMIVILLVAASLLFVALVAGPRVTPAQRVTAAIVAIASIISVEISEYIGWTRAGANLVDGVQGRYFIPILPLLLVAISRASVPPRWTRIAIAAAMTIANGVALFAVWQHYYAA